MRTIILLALLLNNVFSSFSLDNPGSVEEAVYSPEIITAGSMGFLRIRTGENPGPGGPDDVKVAEAEWLYVSDIKVNAGKNEILVWFIPFDSSQPFFPAVIAGNRTYSGIPLPVRSTLTGNSSLSFPSGRILLPGTRLLFAAALVTVIILLAAGYLALKYLPGKIVEVFSDMGKTAVTERTGKRIEHLIGKCGDFTPREFSAFFMRDIREYLEAAAGRNFSCLTTAEIEAEDADMPAAEFRLMDALHYGNASADIKTVAEAAGTIYDCVRRYVLSLESAAGGGRRASQEEA